MSVDASEFKSAMRKFPAAVNVITTGGASGRAGLTATAVFSLTVDPPQVAIAVNRSASAFPLIVAEGNFCVNTLSSGQHHIAGYFSGGRRGEDRFRDAIWEGGITGAPKLADAAIVLDCRVSGSIPYSTHTLFVGDVVSAELGDVTRPLLYVDGGWANLVPSSNNLVAEVEASLDEHIAAIEEGVDDPAAGLSSVVRRMVELNVTQKSPTRELLSWTSFYAQPGDLEVLGSKKDMFDTRLRELLESGAERGDFQIEDVAMLRLAIEGMVGWAYRWYRPDGRLSADDVANKLAHLALRAAGYAGPPGKNQR